MCPTRVCLVNVVRDSLAGFNIYTLYIHAEENINSAAAAVIVICVLNGGGGVEVEKIMCTYIIHIYV